ncbi:DUF1993 domain-containing protein [Tabrizicola sp. J26]|uniref:DUF1993 domain-containing protein n=1 Tax=Alitabrizicola rongguiensis TaxID=2909234 RepID=UPI001F1C8B44|nr:DUF1993 domain-containing protein [Tabrizicola rongguiensis]MCF1707373.1 DUF1993 domain-containing protein [Tabrizicola rongguiensis]
MIHQIAIQPMDRMLVALSNILAKAEAHCEAKKIDPQALLRFRLYPDMFSFTRQVQLTCDFCARAASRLAGDELKSFADTETTFADLRARVAAARAHLASFAPDRFAGAADRPITIKIRGEDVTLPGLTFVTVYSLPQVYFHATTAYDILRHNGVDLGKRDFMAA